MNPNPRYVFDANVVISALLFEKGTAGQAFYTALGRGRILLSDEVTQEINTVLSREKFNRYVAFEERERFMQRFIQEALLIEITEKILECQDQKDNKYIELGVCGEASHLITGDQDLLILNPFREIRILTPRVFLNFMGKRESG